MRSSIQDIPVAVEMPEATIRQASMGSMTIEVGQFQQDFNGESLGKGLPDGRCQCPHWGYVVKGSLQLKFADHEETYRAGDVYYAPPGHIPFVEAGSEYIEFSPTDEYNRTMDAISHNRSAGQ